LRGFSHEVELKEKGRRKAEEKHPWSA